MNGQKQQLLVSQLSKSQLRDKIKTRMSRFLINKSSSKQIQIRKRLNKVESIEQLQKIHTMLKSQNTQLKNDVTILKQHLLKIQQSKKQKQKQKIYLTSRILNSNKDDTLANNIKEKALSSSSQSRVSMSSSQLLISQKQLKNYPTQFIQQYKQSRKYLQQQYKLMGLLKSNITNLQKYFPTQQQNDQRLTQKNKIKSLTTQIQDQLRKKLTLIKENKQLQQTLNKEFTPFNSNQQQILQLQRQNKELKKQIVVFKQQTYRHETKAAKVIDSIYSKKQILTQYEDRDKMNLVGNGLGDKKKRSSSVGNLGTIANKVVDNNDKQTNQSKKVLLNKTKHVSAVSAISNYNILQHKDYFIKDNCNINKVITNKQLSPNIQQQQKQQQQQIVRLKNQIDSLSLASIRAKQSIKRQKQLLKQNNIRLNQNFILLYKTKTKKVSELNHLKAKLKHIIQQIQQKQTLKIKMVNTHTQETQFYSHNKHLLSFRKDFAGVLGPKHRFYDRIFLKQKTKSFIKGLIVYENDNNLSIKGSIAAIRAIYTDQQTNQMNHVPLPGVYLQKCKTQRLQLPQDDFLKLIKVKYNTKQTRVTKIEIRSNRNLRYEFGEKRPFQQIHQNEIVYAFDIGLDEFPVAMFGSYCNVKNCWYLQCIGVEINSLT